MSLMQRATFIDLLQQLGASRAAQAANRASAGAAIAIADAAIAGPDLFPAIDGARIARSRLLALAPLHDHLIRRHRIFDTFLGQPELHNAMRAVNIGLRAVEMAARNRYQAPLGRGQTRNEGWEGAWPMKQGAMSTVGLRLQFDDNHNVIKRMVRKDTYQSLQQWTSAVCWDGQVRDSNNREPMEYACHRAVQRTWLPNGKRARVAQCSSVSTSNQRKMYSIYLSYCPHGDLSILIRRCRAAQPAQFIPEPFIFWVFMSLAETGLAMSQVNYTNDGTTYEVVHRDLKCGNVFLDSPRRPLFGHYPMPRLGDFGLAIKTSADDTFNPAMYSEGAGTDGFMAPE